MSGPSTYAPQTGFTRWLDTRLPILRFANDTMTTFPTPRNLNIWYTFGGILTFCLGVQIVTGIVLAMHYTPTAGRCLRQRREHHARRELRLAAALRARQRRLDVLPRRLHPHVPRPLLRLLQGAARGAVDPGRHHLSADDGDRLLRLRAALGPDVVLGRHRHHQPVLLDRPDHPACRARPSRPGCGAASRSAIRRSTASSRCTTCCPS